MKRLRFTIDVTVHQNTDKYKYLASLLENMIRTSLDFEDVFYLANAKVLRKPVNKKNK